MKNRREFIGSTTAALGGLVAARGAGTPPPNIIWLTGEDMGRQLGCYGYQRMRTPHIDRLAAEGARFDNAFTTAPVCSPSRSAFNTGMYQIATGTQNHRSHRKDDYKLPQGVRLLSHRLRDAGYYTCNVLQIAPGVAGTGKTDFNFNLDQTPYDGRHWTGRNSGQPVFAHVNYREPHKGPAFPEARRQKYLVDPARLDLPPYYADHPVIRDEMANFLDAINLLDYKIGVTLDKMKEDGLLDNAVVFFFGHNGTCLLRGKQWLYDLGIHVPIIVRWPGQVKPASVRTDLVSSLDMSAACLEAAGIELPKPFHGRPLFGKNARARDYIFAARDRCDMTVERIRCIRDHRYHYIRNFMPDRPWTAHNTYIETSYPTQGVMQELFAQGKLNDIQAQFMQPSKPEVEMFDIQLDPWCIHNLAASPRHRKAKDKLGRRLDAWLTDMNDQGATPEPQSVVDANQ